MECVWSCKDLFALRGGPSIDGRADVGLGCRRGQSERPGVAHDKGGTLGSECADNVSIGILRRREISGQQQQQYEQTRP
jgi:hypothetical protein